MEFSATSITIAIDDAGSAGRALDYGLEMAETLKLPVRLVHVARSRTDHGAEVRRLDLAEIQKAAGGIPEYEMGAALLDRALQRAGQRRVDVEPVLLGGDPVNALLRYLDDCDKPMLFVGRRGGGPVRQMLLGSVSDALVRHAACPVVVVS